MSDVARRHASVFDEGHHAAARTYQEVVRRIEPRYGLSISPRSRPYRRRQDRARMRSPGPPLHGPAYSARFPDREGLGCKPVEVRVERLAIRGDMAEKPFGSIYKSSSSSIRRENRKIADCAASTWPRAGTCSSWSTAGAARRRGCFASWAAHRASFTERLPRRSRLLQDDSARFRERVSLVSVATSALLHEASTCHGIEVRDRAGGLQQGSRHPESRPRHAARPRKAVLTYVDFLDDDVAGILRAHRSGRVSGSSGRGISCSSVGRGCGKTGRSRRRFRRPGGTSPRQRASSSSMATGRWLAKALCRSKALVSREDLQTVRRRKNLSGRRNDRMARKNRFEDNVAFASRRCLRKPRMNQEDIYVPFSEIEPEIRDPLAPLGDRYPPAP